MKGTTSFAFRLGVIIALMVGLAATLSVTLNQMKFRQVLEAQQLRVARILAEDMSETLEKSIALGVQLANVPGAQALLDRRRAGDATIARVAVADAAGRILFDTDRRRVGEAAPPSWLAGLRGGTTGQDTALGWVGVPILNSFGRADGAVVLHFRLDSAGERLASILLHMVEAALLALGLALPAAALAIALAARSVRRWFAELSLAVEGEHSVEGGVAGELAVAVRRAGDALYAAEDQLEALAMAEATGTAPPATPAPAAPAQTPPARAEAMA